MNPPPQGVRLVRLGRRRVVVAQPNVRQYGHQADETVFALAYARRLGVPLVFRRPAKVTSEAMFAIESTEVEIDRSPRGRLAAFWAGAVPERSERVHVGWMRAVDRLRKECLRQLSLYRHDHRRNELVKWKIREVKDARADAKLRRPSRHRPYWRRRLVADPVALRLTAEAEAHAVAVAERLGISPETPLVSVHVRERGYKLGDETQDKGAGRDDSVRNARVEFHLPAIDHLVDLGYTVVRVGDPSMAPVDRPGVLDLATSPLHDSYVELYLLWRSAFLICGESGPQGAAYLTDTPSLTVNATDPVSGFPVRTHGIYLMKTIVDRRTDEPLDLEGLLSEHHLLNLRDPREFAYVQNTAEEILDGVREMLDLLEHGTPESPAQQRYKELLVEAIERSQHIAYVQKWGLDSGFLGRGRLGRMQAERLVAGGLARDIVAVET